MLRHNSKNLESYYDKKLSERIDPENNILKTLYENIKTRISECCYFLFKE